NIAGAFPQVDLDNLGVMSVGGIASANVPFLVTGKISGTSDAPKVKLAMTFAGEISVLGFAGSGKGSIKMSCAPDDFSVPTGQSCAGRLHFCGGAAGVGHACAGGPFDSALPASGGDWTLSLELATDESNQVTGSAVVTLGDDNATTGSFTVTGKY